MVELLYSNPKSSPIARMTGNAATGICYWKPFLHFVTLVKSPEGIHHTLATKCATLRFEAREPACTKILAREITVTSKRLKFIKPTFRIGASKGRYQPNPLSFKVEALLELQFGKGLSTIESASVARWAGKQAFEWPDLIRPKEGQFSGAWENGQLRAVETAAFALDREAVQSSGKPSA